MPGVEVLQTTGLPVSVRLLEVDPVPVIAQRWISEGRPAVCAEREIICPVPSRGGTLLMPVIRGIGSSTVTVLVMLVQPPELQDLSVTCLVPGVENVTEGFRAVDGACPRTGAAIHRSPAKGARGIQPTRREPTCL